MKRAAGEPRPFSFLHPLNNEQTSAIRSVLEDAMTNAAQAFLLTAGLFGLSFFTIFALWYAERLRFGAAGKLPL
jgi:hypothetical protein